MTKESVHSHEETGQSMRYLTGVAWEVTLLSLPWLCFSRALSFGSMQRHIKGDRLWAWCLPVRKQQQNSGQSWQWSPQETGYPPHKRSKMKESETLLGCSSKDNTMVFMKQECSGPSAALTWSSLKSGSWVQVSGAHVLCWYAWLGDKWGGCTVTRLIVATDSFRPWILGWPLQTGNTGTTGT